MRGAIRAARESFRVRPEYLLSLVEYDLSLSTIFGLCRQTLSLIFKEPQSATTTTAKIP